MSSDGYSYDDTTTSAPTGMEYRGDSYSSGVADTTRYTEKRADIPPRAGGADDLQTGVTTEQEGTAAAEREDTDRFSKDQTDYPAGLREEERSKMGTRGMKTDPFNQDSASDSMRFRGERT